MMITAADMRPDTQRAPGVPRVVGPDSDPSIASSSTRGPSDPEGFLIARFPVTLGEYLEFINALEAYDPELAIAHMPRRSSASNLVQNQDSFSGIDKWSS